ncbi:orotidine-5'-phosphate decarboxylase [Dehalococcoidia bacterium]|nr:orotidine-5'-phosphate decarboxylase [Dehalococcoidia bacterium]
MSHFLDRLSYISGKNRSLVCVGLDPDPTLMPIRDVLAFNKAVVDTTKDLVCAFKPNLAYYEALGLDGLRALGDTVKHIRSVAPDVLVIGDGKRGDIESTNLIYARALFEFWEFDAATVNAYAGISSLEPFFEYGDRGVLVWCRSSNPGAGDLQDIALPEQADGMPIFESVALKAVESNNKGNLGLVVGATYPEELGSVRERATELPILVPGIGKQGGDLERSVRAGLACGEPRLLISSSRGITYASKDPRDFADAAGTAATNLRDRINRTLHELGRGW